MRPAAWTSRVRTAGLVLLTVSDTALAGSYHDLRTAFAEGRVHQPGDPMVGVALLYPLLAIALPVLVGFRRRIPVWVTLVGAVLTTVLWLGPTVALIGLYQVIVRRPRRDAWRVGAAVTVATTLCTWRDLTTQPRDASFWGTLIEPDGGSWLVPAFITLLLVGIPVGAGAWTLTRTELAETASEVDAGRQHVSALTDQLSRQAERERIAREIHDGLGHRLSLLSVHAGALQAVASEGPDPRAADEIRTSAALIRESASESMTELHSLLALLRNPDDPDIAAAKVTLADVGRLIDDSVAAGMPLVATVFVDGGESLDAQHAQATFRIVQELLTNARKHAPGVPVRLSVTGGERTGSLDIATANHLPRETARATSGHPGVSASGSKGPVGAPPMGSSAGNPGGGSGLSGIRERAERLGGTMHAGLDPAGVFRVQIHLPWPA